MSTQSDEHAVYLTKILAEQELYQKRGRIQKDTVSELEDSRESLIEAQTVITELFIDCSQEAREVIELITNLALQSVFGDKYRFALNYEIKRNQVEAPPILYKYGMPRDLKDECGEGVVDIISFGFRMAIWALNPNKSHIFVLDEPFKSVAEINERAAAEMLRETFSSLNIQCLLNSHSQNFIDHLDKVYIVKEIDKITGSKVTLKKR